MERNLYTSTRKFKDPDASGSNDSEWYRKHEWECVILHVPAAFSRRYSKYLCQKNCFKQGRVLELCRIFLLTAENHICSRTK